MSVNWRLYKELLGNGIYTDRRGVVMEQAAQAFVAGMVDDPAYQSDAYVNGENTPIIASRTSSLACAIKAAPETDIHIGDMVECFGEHWIVVELYADKVGVISGEMWLCNNLLRFQNRSRAVIARYCVVDDGTYSKKSSDPDAFVMANTYRVYLTIDNATEKLFVDKRLAFGQIYSADGEKILEVYKIIGIDVKSKNFGSGSHLMMLTVQRDVYDKQADSIEDNICDIFVDESNNIVPKPTGSCAISGRDTVRIGTSRKYVVSFADAEGASIPDAEPVWSVVAPDGIFHTVDGFQCTITVPLDEKYVGESIDISVSDEGGEYGICEKKVQVITVG